MKHPEFDQMVALAERLRPELDSSDRRNLVGSQIIPDKSSFGAGYSEAGTETDPAALPALSIFGRVTTTASSALAPSSIADT
jgi:hypothetical protein